MKQNVIRTLATICIICLLSLITETSGYCTEDIVAKKYDFYEFFIYDGSREYKFKSQTGVGLPVLEYMDSIYVPIRSFCEYLGKSVEWQGDAVMVEEKPLHDYEGKVYGEIQDNYDYPIVSMIELIANPEKYDGKKVSVKGIINIGYESDRLFLTKEDHRYYNIENSIGWSPYSLEMVLGVENLKEFYQVYGALTGIMVEMQGTFVAEDLNVTGYGSRGFLKEIKSINCLETIV